MADPLSVAGSVVGIISLAIQATQTLSEFYDAYKSQKSDIANILKKLDNLLLVLQSLRDNIDLKTHPDKRRRVSDDDKNLLKSVESSIGLCVDDIDDLQQLAQKFSRSSTDRESFRDATRLAAYQVSYPFRRATLQRLENSIDEIVSHLSLALQVLGLKDLSHAQDEIEETRALLNLVRAQQISSTIRTWFRAPDATQNYYHACDKRHAGTGLWFVQGDDFSKWLAEESSFLWLNGFAGCGKSVLCSTAIQHTFRHRHSNPRVGIAFFFFTFTDDSKQDASSMIKALILQLSGQSSDNHNLSYLHDNYKTGSPPKPALMDCLRQLVTAFDDVYILLDALDESPRETHRPDVLESIADLRSWKGYGLHLLLTSRDEIDIHDSLCHSAHIVSLRNEFHDVDIADFVSRKLKTDPKLSSWKNHHDEIERALTEGAGGVFRWVECQFTRLASCPRSKRHLDTLLKSLPRSLDQTYDRMLKNIDEEYAEDARRMLILLCCSHRVLTPQEVIEGVAVELGDQMRLNPDGRLADEQELRRICPGLIEVDTPVSYDKDGCASKGRTTVRIAHYSVQEYLQSNRVDKSVAAFRIIEEEAHAELAAICLAYLLETADISVYNCETEYPLGRYAAEQWYRHYHQADKSMYSIDAQARRLFRENALERWYLIHDMVEVKTQQHLDKTGTELALHCASRLGFCSILQDLMTESIPQIDSPDKRNITTVRQRSTTPDGEPPHQDKWYRDALYWGAFYNHGDVVRLLIDNGVDPDGLSPEGQTPLVGAASRGHEAMTRLLIDRGANINARTIDGDTALVVACMNWDGGESIVLLLLQRGANVNAPGGLHNSALNTAAVWGSEATARVLLRHGANIHAESLTGRSPLLFAAAFGHEGVVRLLLDEDANVHAFNDRCESALQAACSKPGNEAVIRLLLDKGADIHSRGGGLGTPLEIASSLEMNDAVIRLLIQKGANLNAEYQEASAGQWSERHALNSASAEHNRTTRHGQPYTSIDQERRPSTGWRLPGRPSAGLRLPSGPTADREGGGDGI